MSGAGGKGRGVSGRCTEEIATRQHSSLQGPIHLLPHIFSSHSTAGCVEVSKWEIRLLAFQIVLLTAHMPRLNACKL